MTDQETFILTHYTDISETKRRDVGRMQSEIIQSALRKISAAMAKGLQKTLHRNALREFDQV
ncbi:hypothetical protein [Aestuariicoccus sp. MJ-SS9]|uniref:hypothetical protein n=1 Tax=Aestuariicoccus sp. MJ-SS9 TaxID=3079855 RepID=UPI00290AFD8B|nr:hypothetical protein [Aestuariicoccus sp. MJ-SS9]MDU8911447.1 hypothetical protein [Aestuariicoccus sp. MJ-SS9]